MASVVINGRVFTTGTRNISVVQNGDQIFINGELVGEDFIGSSKQVNVTVEGDVDKVETSAGDIVVNGNAGTVKSTSGDVEVGGDVSGSVSSVSGDVDVNGHIGGSVSTVSGDVRHRR